MPGTQASWPPSGRPTASTCPRRARPAPRTLDIGWRARPLLTRARPVTSTARSPSSARSTPRRALRRAHPIRGGRPGPAPESTACAQPVHDLTRKPSTPSPRTQQGGLAHRDERGIVCPPSRGWKARVAASKRALRSSRARLPLEGQQQALHPLQLSGIDGRCSGEHAWPGAARTLELAFLHKLIASTAPPCHPSRAAEATGSLLSRARCPSQGGLRLRASPVLCSSTCTRNRRRWRCGSHAPASPTTFSFRGRESSPPAHTAVRGPFGTRTSRSAGRPVAFSGTQPVEPDPNPPACGCRGPSPPVHNRRGLFQVRVQSHRRTAPGLRPKERVLGTYSVRAVVPPGVTGLVRLVYGLAARERLGTGYPPPALPVDV